MAHQMTFTPPSVAQLTAHRAELARTTFYLGDASVRRSIAWKRPEGTKGRSHLLVAKADSSRCRPCQRRQFLYDVGCQLEAKHVRAELL